MVTKLFDVRAFLAARFAEKLKAERVVVFDGPRAGKTDPKRFLLVGTEGGEDGGGDPFADESVATQSISPEGNGWRHEVGYVLCGAWAWDGGTDSTKVLGHIRDVVEICATAVSEDRSLGGLLFDGYAEFTGLRLRNWESSAGAAARGGFTVSYKTLIV